MVESGIAPYHISPDFLLRGGEALELFEVPLLQSSKDDLPSARLANVPRWACWHRHCPTAFAADQAGKKVNRSSGSPPVTRPAVKESIAELPKFLSYDRFDRGEHPFVSMLDCRGSTVAGARCIVRPTNALGGRVFDESAHGRI